MTNEITIKKDPLEASLELRGMDKRQFRVIREVLYPNVQKDETLLMALDYCKARKLDIFKRSIQIVPIWNSKTKRMEDTIWPSISEIRTTATRTGQYAGCSEGEFGEEITENLNGVETKYPKFCKVIVYRMVAGSKYEFSAKLFWKETYKTAKNDTTAPNSMWLKRAYAQLEKCTEAAALRKAFPEEIGNDFIAEEAFNANDIRDVTPQSKPAATSMSVEDLKNPTTEENKVVAEIEPEQEEEQEQEVDKSEAIFKKHESAIKSYQNQKSIEAHFNYLDTKNDLDYLLEHERTDLLAQLEHLKKVQLNKIRGE